MLVPWSKDCRAAVRQQQLCTEAWLWSSAGVADVTWYVITAVKNNECQCINFILMLCSCLQWCKSSQYSSSMATDLLTLWFQRSWLQPSIRWCQDFSDLYFTRGSCLQLLSNFSMVIFHAAYIPMMQEGTIMEAEKSLCEQYCHGCHYHSSMTLHPKTSREQDTLMSQ